MGIGNIKDCYHQLSKDIVINSLTHEYRLIIPLLLILQDLLIQNSQVEFCPHMWFRKRLKLIILLVLLEVHHAVGMGWGGAVQLLCVCHMRQITAPLCISFCAILSPSLHFSVIFLS